jgi:hypothetical protein
LDELFGMLVDDTDDPQLEFLIRRSEEVVD